MFSAVDVAFCADCGSLLPAIPAIGNSVACGNCGKKASADVLAAGAISTYEVVFNALRDVNARQREDDDEGPDGPTVERRCPKCGHEEMSYAALQLRSADEGQTVFFTCLKCKYKESENS